MDDHLSLIHHALEELDNTAFLLNQESSADDPAVLWPLVKRLYDCQQRAIHALLTFEKKWKRLSAVPKDAKSQLQLLKNHYEAKLSISPEETLRITKLKNMLQERAEKPDPGEIFILQRNLQINASQLKPFLSAARAFTNRINTYIKDGRIN